MVAYVPSSIGYVERMKPPGAPMSGLSASSAPSPYELNEEIIPPVGFGTHECRRSRSRLRTGPRDALSTIALPSAGVIVTTGIVTGRRSRPACR